MPLGQGRHNTGVVHDEGRVDAIHFKEITHQLVQQPRSGLRRRTVNLVLCTQINQELVGLRGLQWRDLDTQLLFKTRQHPDSLERRREIDLFVLVFHLIAACHLQYHLCNQLLRHLNEVIVICVGHVEFTGGELRVVRQVDTFVAELSPDLVHSVHAPHHQHFQIQLRSNPHVQLHVQLVVLGDERLGHSATGNHVHHGSLNLQKVPVIQELAEERNDFGPSDKCIARRVVHDQIQVSLAIPGLLIMEPCVILRQHVKARAEKLKLLGLQAEFPRRGATWNPADADDVPAMHALMDFFELVLVFIFLELAQNLYLLTVPS
mmetsp:Transcript_76742/g.128980  ORF Transcript_76742/g.128980 Transcript_76742/m.128980 type:complete len:320 (-) Transcript_76742:438-1397(-)